jgi:formamidopyrimidine-DNA glycosylase
MPELPEVHRAAAYIKRHAQGQRLMSVQAFPDAIVFDGVAPGDFERELAGRVLIDVRRHGKVFWLEFAGRGRHPVCHFGMTGSVRFRGHAPLEYVEAKGRGDDSWPPRWCKFVMRFPDAELAFTDPRRLARVRLCTDPAAEPPVCALGPDPVLGFMPRGAFAALLAPRKAPIKALLLDQSAMAGIGNWVADEVLYQARIHPLQPCNTLRAPEVALLYDTILRVTRFAVAVDADAAKFPRDWLFHYRWAKGRKETPRVNGQHRISFVTAGGRTSAIVDGFQKLRKRDADPAEAAGDAEGAAGGAVATKAEAETEVAAKAEKKRGRTAAKATPATKKAKVEEARAETPARSGPLTRSRRRASPQ